MAAHSNLKCNLTYQFSPADSKFDDWKQMYEQASLKIASACQILEGSVASASPLGTAFEGRSAFHQLLDSARVFSAKR